MTGTEFHLSLQMMERYLDESLPDFEQAAVEDHLEACAQCAETLQRMDAVLFAGFTAKSHAAAIAAETFQRDPLANALRAAQRVRADYVGTLQRWLGTAASLWGASPSSEWGEWEAVPISSKTPTPIKISLRADESRARVRVHLAAMTVMVTLHGRSSGLVLLFAKEAEGAIFAEALKAGEKESTVEFPNVPDGEYYLAVAPPEAASE